MDLGQRLAVDLGTMGVRNGRKQAWRTPSKLEEEKLARHGGERDKGTDNDGQGVNQKRSDASDCQVLWVSNVHAGTVGGVFDQPWRRTDAWLLSRRP